MLLACGRMFDSSISLIIILINLTSAFVHSLFCHYLFYKSSMLDRYWSNLIWFDLLTYNQSYVQLRLHVQQLPRTSIHLHHGTALSAQRQSHATTRLGHFPLIVQISLTAHTRLVTISPLSMNYQRFQQMIELVTQVGDPFDKKRSYKFPLTAAELLSA